MNGGIAAGQEEYLDFLLGPLKKTCCRDNDCFGFVRSPSFQNCMMQSDNCCAFPVIQDGVWRPCWKREKS